MKRSVYICFLLLLASWMSAQDMMRLSEQDIQGSARYVGMAGAMTAVGGDPSAVHDNPAGLGIYRRMEVQMTLGDCYATSQQVLGEVRGSVNRFGLPQASMVLSFQTNREGRGVLFNNFLLGYQRVRAYNNVYGSKLVQQSTSLADVICQKTAGATEEYMHNSSMWSDPEMGWLSRLGYETYLINPTSEGSDQWMSVLQSDETVDATLQVQESGYVDEYSMDWAMNISNKCFIGLGLRMHSYSWEKRTQYVEQFEREGGLATQTSLTMSGFGVSGIVGLIYHPIEMLRLGASLQTPSAGALTIYHQNEMSVQVDSFYTCATPQDGERLSAFHLPMRLSASMAWQMRQWGMLSLQYNYAHYSDRDDMHSLRAGLEIVPYSKLYLQAGYAYESTFKHPLSSVPISYNSTRVDTDVLQFIRRQYASVGIGYRGKALTVQAAYQYGWADSQLQAHELATLVPIHSQTHRVVVTIGWHSL